MWLRLWLPSSLIYMKKLKLFLIIIILLFVGCFFGYNYLKGSVSSQSEVVIFEVEKGQSFDQVLNSLNRQGLIKNSLVAKIESKLKGYNQVFAGKFKLDKSWDLNKILNYLADSKNIELDQIKLTFVEGKWAKHYAQLISEVTNQSADSILKLWNDDAFVKKMISKYSVLSNDILNKDLKVKLEGYFYPDTYFFDKNSTIETITEKLLEQTQKFYEDNKKLFLNSKYSVHQIYTLASIVQFEASKADDQKLVASVFINRLKQKMPLQSSVTVCYALYDYTDWKQCETNIKIDSVYNTYLHNGLPIGPVSNPSSNALMSVLNPVDSKYLFFLTDVLGDGTTYFSETYEQHVKYKQKYLDGAY